MLRRGDKKIRRAAQMKIVCFHLFNNYSGSPTILCTVLQGLLERGYDIDLITSSGKGALDDLQGNFHRYVYNYDFSDNKLCAFLKISLVQIYTFFLSFRYLFRKNVVFYINTLLPILPAVAGKLMGKRVIFHYHENAHVKGLYYRLKCKCMEWLADEIICVSQYQASFLKRGRHITVVHNSLSDKFINALNPNPQAAFGRKTVLMLSSLSKHKGVCDFIVLAAELPDYEFNLIISDTNANIARFIENSGLSVPDNLHIYDRQKDTVPFYNAASIVVNMTDRRFAVETFGLTALEAMAAGLPTIVPTVGGIAEIVKDGVNGYKCDSTDLKKIAETIELLLTNEKLYLELADNALKEARRYDVRTMINNIEDVLCR